MPDFRVSGPSRVQFLQRLGPSWKELADYFEVASHIRATWPLGGEPRALLEHLESRGKLASLPPALIELDRADLAELLLADPQTPAASDPRRPLLLVVAAVLVLATAATIWVVQHHSKPSASGLPADYVRLKLAPAPSTTSWGTPLTCEQGPTTQWTYAFPVAYVGDVYVQFTADARKTVDVRATLNWGKTWSQTVPAWPGDPERHLGGTLLIFQKLSADAHAPKVDFETDVPVCAVFGTAADPVLAAPSLSRTTPGWR